MRRIGKFKKSSIILILLLMFISLVLSACTSTKMNKYYTEKSNYINASGTVRHITYNSDKNVLYLGFSDLSPSFDDNSFKIVGDNLPIVQKNNIDEKIKTGDKVEFITAPKYFGDGYVMPIVAISVNGEELLEFEEGYDNFIKWLKSK